MAPVQNTFSIIPNAPSAVGNLDAPAGKPSRPPMTSKQAKKLHKNRNKEPKLTKAEQRLRDLMEQDRIRKEFEKDRNQARARVAREKKREKEEQFRADRKKKGLPLVDVRPSQGTIASFIRGNTRPAASKSEGSSAGVQAAEDEDSSDSDSDRSQTKRPSVREGSEPLAKRLRTSQSPQIDISGEQNNSQGLAEPKLPQNATSIPAKEEPRAMIVTTNPGELETRNFNAENLVAEIAVHQQVLSESFDASDLEAFEALQALEAERINTHESLNTQPSESNTPPEDSETQAYPEKAIREESPRNFKEEEKIIARTPLDPKSGNIGKIVISDATKASSKETVAPSHTEASLATLTPQVSSLKAKTPLQKSTSAKPFQLAKNSMGPPPVPPKFKSSYQQKQSSWEPAQPKFLPSKHDLKEIKTPEKGETAQFGLIETPSDSSLPPSTQAFLLSNIDDLFPSPSQEVEEIFQDKQPTFYPTKLPVVRRRPGLISAKPRIQQPSPQVTQQTTLRSHSMTTQASHTLSAAKSAPAISLTLIPTEQSPSTDELGFLSTQDLFLSSQDVRELESETESPCKQIPEVPAMTPPRNEIIKLPAIAPPAGVLPSSNESIPENSPATTHGPTAQSSADQGLQNLTQPLLSKTYTTNSRGTDMIVPMNEAVLSQKPDLVCSANSTHSALLSYEYKNTGVERTRAAEAPRPSPKPFFTSSGRAMRCYALHRLKTTLWEDETAQQKARAHFESLENERLVQLLSESREEEPDRLSTILQEAQNMAPAIGQSSRPLDESALITDKGLSPDMRRVEERFAISGRGHNKLNELSSTTSQKSEPQKALQSREGPRRTQPKSSYEKMLEILAREDSSSSGICLNEETIPANQSGEIQASQETDYGDVDWDDELNDFL